MNTYIVLAAVIGLTLVNYGNAISLEEELTLTHPQKLKLDEFRKVVTNRLPHDYMKKDIYLVRWLRARNFNLRAAEQMLMENIKWRKENRMDTIHQEDWSFFEREYRYNIEGCDKEGRPVVSVPVGDWDVRKAVVAGQSERMMRYFDKLMDEVNMVIRTAQDQGHNVTQYNHIFDMGQYNLRQQGCPLCIPIFVHLFTSYEIHFPGGVHRMYMVKTPEIFESLFQILRPLMSRATSDSLKIYGKDKRVWKQGLLNDIDADQLTVPFGGTKDAGFEIEEYRAVEKLPCKM